MSVFKRSAFRGRPGLRRLRDGEEGSVTAEFVIWLSFFLTLVFMVTDVSIVAYRYTQMWDVARSAAREVAMGAIPRTQAGVEAYVRERLSEDYAVTLTGYYTTYFEISIEAAPQATGVFGLFEAAAGGLTARVGMGKEPMASA
ncbi:MAG: TadE/TadG family type IV pilus assembly protein [Pseudomonadota bacterium]